MYFQVGDKIQILNGNSLYLAEGIYTISNTYGCTHHTEGNAYDLIDSNGVYYNFNFFMSDENIYWKKLNSSNSVKVNIEPINIDTASLEHSMRMIMDELGKKQDKRIEDSKPKIPEKVIIKDEDIDLNLLI